MDKDWLKVRKEGIYSLKKNHTWRGVEKSENRRLVGSKGAFKRKEEIHGG